MGESSRTSGGNRLFAAVYDRVGAVLEVGSIGAARRSLLTQARGVVVDLGSGTGTNLPHLGPAVTRVHLVEPDPHMVRRLRTRLPEHAQVHQLGAEHLPFADHSVDTVLATLTLCTVDDLAASVSEIRRVLRPDGQVLVLEHVRAPGARMAGWQDSFRRPWEWTFAGCQVNRDTVSAFATAGFDTTGLTRFGLPKAALASEWVTGRLPRPD